MRAELVRGYQESVRNKTFREKFFQNLVAVCSIPFIVGAYAYSLGFGKEVKEGDVRGILGNLPKVIEESKRWYKGFESVDSIGYSNI